MVNADIKLTSKSGMRLRAFPESLKEPFLSRGSEL